MGRAGLMILGFCGFVALASCEKVPIIDIHASFPLADASWFEDEETLFIFYRVTAEQGIGEDSQVEVSYRTDPFNLPWTPTTALPMVHTHLPVDCGPNARCGSLSLHVPDVPTSVGIRLRYHREGEIFLGSTTAFNVVAAGPAHSNRSLIVYGVFDGTNTQVQWRARHQFPTVRNEEAQALGLRRWFAIDGRQFGDVGGAVDFSSNPYGYGFAAGCPAGMTALGALRLETSDRAIFEPAPLPQEAVSQPAVCALSTVTDATGTFQVAAVARKNPEVRPAFPTLRSPIVEDRAVQFLLRICNREISAPHLAMQQQRLLQQGATEVCLDDWRSPTFADELAGRLSARIDQARALGDDMVLTIALHHDERTGALAQVIEAALNRVLPPERDRTSPRVSGAFVFDSYRHPVQNPELAALVLWCPNDLGASSPLGSAICPVMPDIPNIPLGPFTFNTLPILPTRAKYLDFIATYSDAQGGQMKALRFLAPERTPLSDNVVFPPFGVVTFFNGEQITAAPGDAFSYGVCPEDFPEGSPPPPPLMFRPDAQTFPMELAMLPDFHAASPQPSYALGLWWASPFLLRLNYEVVIAGSATAFDLSVPFGVGVQSEVYEGAQLWLQDSFSSASVLKQCTRFCDHPTFSGSASPDQLAGVYEPLALFRDAYRTSCYRPAFPAPGDGGFPRDP